MKNENYDAGKVSSPMTCPQHSTNDKCYEALNKSMHRVRALNHDRGKTQNKGKWPTLAVRNPQSSQSRVLAADAWYPRETKDSLTASQESNCDRPQRGRARQQTHPLTVTAFRLSLTIVYNHVTCSSSDSPMSLSEKGVPIPFMYRYMTSPHKWSETAYTLILSILLTPNNKISSLLSEASNLP